MKLIIRILSIVFVLGNFMSPAFAVEPVYSDSSDKAIKGYDTVAYFTDAKPVKGSSDFTYEYNGANWYFSSAENRDAFINNPEQYAPQFGGYCAWAVSRGYTAKIDPDAWHIRENKLYLNYSKSVRRQWKGDIPGNIAKAQSNWPTLLSE